MQRFVDASLEGWYNYLYGDQRGGQRADQEGQPRHDRRPDRLRDRGMKKYGIVDSGDALTHGIGAMTEARWESFFDKMVEAGVLPGRPRSRRPTRSQFVNKGVGPRAEAAGSPASDAFVELRPPAPPRTAASPHRHLARRREDASRTARWRWPARPRRRAGEFVSLLGPSGCGKSHGAAHHRRPRRAERAAASSWHGGGYARGRGIGFVFQEPTLMPWATVFDNVWLPLRLKRRRGRRRRRSGSTAALAHGRAERLRRAPIRASCRAA